MCRTGASSGDSLTPLMPRNASSFLIWHPFGIGLLRYRLWDIDVLINRALMYDLLTGILLLLYIGLIFGDRHCS